MVTNKMSLASRIEYLKRVKPRYLKADKKEKSNILDEFCKNTGYVRKYAIRRLAPQNTISVSKTINRKRSCFYTDKLNNLKINQLKIVIPMTSRVTFTNHSTK